MDTEEHAVWVLHNAATTGQNRAKSPCEDCTRSFSNEMRLIDLCDGEPARTGGPIHSEARRASWRKSNEKRKAKRRAA